MIGEDGNHPGLVSLLPADVAATPVGQGRPYVPAEIVGCLRDMAVAVALPAPTPVRLTASVLIVSMRSRLVAVDCPVPYMLRWQKMCLK